MSSAIYPHNQHKRHERPSLAVLLLQTMCHMRTTTVDHEDKRETKIAQQPDNTHSLSKLAKPSKTPGTMLSWREFPRRSLVEHTNRWRCQVMSGGA